MGAIAGLFTWNSPRRRCLGGWSGTRERPWDRRRWRAGGTIEPGYGGRESERLGQSSTGADSLLRRRTHGIAALALDCSLAHLGEQVGGLGLRFVVGPHDHLGLNPVKDAQDPGQ